MDIRDMIRIQMQQNVTAPLAGMAGGLLGTLFGGGSSVAPYVAGGGQILGSAEGNIMSGAGISAYSNSIISQPLFPFAKGIGLMGEDGDEAIMPLTRNKSGTLVGDARGIGGGNTQIVNIIESAEKAGTQKKRTDSSGGVDIIDVFVARIKNEIWSDVATGHGEGPDTLANVYGLNRVVGAY